ncbi:hypothetical protein ABIE27_001454 [Paenibacillus sp. 4624]
MDVYLYPLFLTMKRQIPQNSRVKGWYDPAPPHQTVREVFPHTAFRCFSSMGMQITTSFLIHIKQRYI